MKLRNLFFLVFSLVALVMAGCGGDHNNGVAGTTVKGAAVKGPLSGGTVTFWSFTSSRQNPGMTQLKTTPAVVTTAADGSYGPVTLNYTGPLYVEVTGGTYTDEATGAANTPLVGFLSDAVANAKGSITVPLTTLTTLAVEKAGGLARRQTGTTAVNGLIKAQLGTTTFDVSATPTTDANYKFAQGMISQLSKNTGKPTDFVVDRLAAGINDDGTINAVADPTLQADITKAINDFSKNANADTFKVTVTAGANGAVSPGTQIFNKGDSQVYTITANAGSVITNVLLDGVSQGAVASLTLNNIVASHTISATFGAPGPVQHTLAIVKLSTAGALPAATLIGSISAHVIANPSAGLTIAANDVATSGVSVSAHTLLAPNVANVANVVIGLINADGFQTGEFATLQYHIAAGTFPTEADFTIANGAAVTDVNSAVIPGITVTKAVTFQ